MNHKHGDPLELADVRAGLIGLLQERIGPALTTKAAQAALEQARAWSPLRARELHRYFAEHPDALTAPSSHCPMALVRLLIQLVADGHGGAVTQLACAICGRAGRMLTRRTPEGRCCEWCVARTELRRCARCGQNGHIVRKTEEGSICRTCYNSDAQFWPACAGCGQRKRINVRRDDGAALCQTCAPRPEHDCVRCGVRRPAQAITEDGPVCNTCYEAPARLCGGCGRVRPITRRAVDGHPDLCAGCYLGPVEECTACGRHRSGRHVGERGGSFHCGTCQPRPLRECGGCGRQRTVRAIWPIGPVCDACYDRRRRNPEPCARCRITQVLVGRADGEGDLCGPCCGTDITFSCSRCGFPGDIYADGACSRCVVGDRVRNLLSQDDGTIAPALQPLADALTSADNPATVVAWLRRSGGPKILAGFVSQGAEITHASLDVLPQDPTTRYVRELLLATGILPPRQENLARLEIWLATTLKSLPPHQARIIHPFAEWSIIRDARRRAARGRYRIGAAASDRADIRVAVEFLTWLDRHQLDLGAVGQEDLDLWLTTHPKRHRSIGSFVRWTTARRLTGDLTLPKRSTALPSQFLDEHEHHGQLKRCLNDDALPLEVRITGALVGLYALSLVRIAELTVDRFQRDGGSAYLTIDRNPVLLPPKLGRLIEQKIAQPRSNFMLRPQQEHGPALLLPGRFPNQPLSAGRLHTLMKQHDLPVISARNTAMLEAVADLPPIVISDLFGIHPNTAYTWAQFAQDSWSDYLAARDNNDERPHPVPVTMSQDPARS